MPHVASEMHVPVPCGDRAGSRGSESGAQLLPNGSACNNFSARTSLRSARSECDVVWSESRSDGSARLILLLLAHALALGDVAAALGSALSVREAPDAASEHDVTSPSRCAAMCIGRARDAAAARVLAMRDGRIARRVDRAGHADATRDVTRRSARRTRRGRVASVDALARGGLAELAGAAVRVELALHATMSEGIAFRTSGMGAMRIRRAFDASARRHVAVKSGEGAVDARPTRAARRFGDVSVGGRAGVLVDRGCPSEADVTVASEHGDREDAADDDEPRGSARADAPRRAHHALRGLSFVAPSLALHQRARSTSAVASARAKPVG